MPTIRGFIVSSKLPVIKVDKIREILGVIHCAVMRAIQMRDDLIDLDIDPFSQRIALVFPGLVKIEYGEYFFKHPFVPGTCEILGQDFDVLFTAVGKTSPDIFFTHGDTVFKFQA